MLSEESGDKQVAGRIEFVCNSVSVIFGGSSVQSKVIVLAHAMQKLHQKRPETDSVYINSAIWIGEFELSVVDNVSFFRLRYVLFDNQFRVYQSFVDIQNQKILFSSLYFEWRWDLNCRQQGSQSLSNLVLADTFAEEELLKRRVGVVIGVVHSFVEVVVAAVGVDVHFDWWQTSEAVAGAEGDRRVEGLVSDVRVGVVLLGRGLEQLDRPQTLAVRALASRVWGCWG